MKSDIRQQYPSRLAIVGYLRQSPGGSALGVDLTQGEASELARGKPWWKFWQSDAAARGANAIPVLPQ
jgi:hypothetical protein